MLLVAAVAVGMPFVLTLYAQQVLGYSAVKFESARSCSRLRSRPARSSLRPLSSSSASRTVAATGMALMGAGSLLLTQVSVSGSYFGDIFFGLLVSGPGIGLAFVTATVAALAGVAEHEARLRAQQHRPPDRRSARRRHRHDGCGLQLRRLPGGKRRCEPLVVLNRTSKSAFLACVVLAGIGLALALLLLGRPRKAPQERAEAVPVPVSERLTRRSKWERS